ncbi:MAG: hypothetical protein ABIP38_03635, partial [Steroidobacteraceae bacterium]
MESNTARERKPAVIVALGVAAALLAGCASHSYRVDKVNNPVALPAAWESPAVPADAPAITKDWWSNFSSPELSKLIAEAMQDSPTLA